MPFEQRRFTRREMLKGAVLALAGGAFAGCDEVLDLPPTPGAPVAIGSFRTVGYGMYENFDRLRLSLNKVDRAVLEELIRRKDLLIHVFLATGRLRRLESRGGKSAPASTLEMKLVCDFHPIVGRFAWDRNWDVAYDPERTKWFEENYRIPNPPEAVLYHEIFGHVIPCLRNPGLIDMLEDDEGLKKENECAALDIENRYRKQMGYREVPRELIKCPLPKR